MASPAVTRVLGSPSDGITSRDSFGAGDEALIAHQQQRIALLEAELQRAYSEIDRLHTKSATIEKLRPWTPNEDRLFIEAVDQYRHRDVKTVAHHIGSRTAMQVRARAQKLFRRHWKHQHGSAKARAIISPLSNKAGMATAAPAHILSLDGDAILCVLDELKGALDVNSLSALRSVCSELTAPARGVLSRLSPNELAHALVIDRVPEECMVTVERQVAHTIIRGELDAQLASQVLALANRAVEQAGHGGFLFATGWTLTTETAGDDPANDRSFKLHGFANAPSIPSSPPLQYPHLPCVLGGVPRYMRLAGSRRDRARVRCIPLEMCRVVSAPVLTACPSRPGGKGMQLVAALLTARMQCNRATREQGGNVLMDLA